MSFLDHPFNGLQTVRERIRQRRAQVLVHSCIYYRLNGSVVDDHTWQRWANELRDLQRQFGEVIGYHDEAFKDWTGTTGHDLPLGDPHVLATAIWLVGYEDTATLASG